MSAIPDLVRPLLSKRGLETIERVTRFVEDEVMPVEHVYEEQLEAQGAANRWKKVPPVIEELKEKAKSKGLWNLFLSSHYKEGAGYTNLEYALMAEQMGRCHIAAEAMNCNAPDTGNMEVLAKYGNDEQKKQWLEPLLNGKIRSAFCMTEKGVASSDATNIQLSMRKEGNEYVLNGTKWWASGAGDPRCEILLVMGKTNPNASTYKQQSVILVPTNTPGVKIVRPMHVIGYDDAPHGHMEIEFTNVRVPVSNMVLGEGRGFEIIQGRLGPGRIHHCMRTLGAAEQALRYMIRRANDPNRKTFNKMLKEHGTVLEWIARSRLEIDAGRLLVLAAAHKIDAVGAKGALTEISKAKIECPNVCLRVCDRAMQVHGAEGVSQDTPLARIWAHNRTLRIADGPDEVHINQLARREIAAQVKAAKL
uniref:ARAD1C11880p n=1 Tax=Blastobotrys adeninivorans TaxID=409370 RepID=A0A060T0X4_BLAAD